MQYSTHKDANLNARLSSDLLERIDAKARAFKMTRSELLRQMILTAFATRDEINKEHEIRAWLRAGMPGER